MLRARVTNCALASRWALRALAVTALSVTASAQLAPPAREIPLYPGVAPGSENWNYQERTGGTPEVPQALNIVRPVLLYYPADKSKAVGTAMIVAPGGGFHTLMMSYEGVDVARRLNQMGVEAFVLKYRTTYVDPDARSGAARGGSQPAGARGTASTGPQAGQNIRELAGSDGRQAVRLLRQRAAEFGVLPNRIGIIGYSAGGSVVMSTIYGPPDAKPDFAAPIYGVRANSNPPPDGAPPLFIAVASDDKTMGFQGSVDLFAAWIKAGIPAELHVFQIGQHGFLKKGGGADHYLDRLEEWMRVNGFLSRATN
jgi:acetyl esterase/lipase